jgi:hypothetical protein
MTSSWERRSDMTKQLKTLVFVVVVGGVLALFAYLGSQEGARRMPTGPMHKLRFDLNGQLLGTETDPVVDLQKPLPEGFKHDKRAVEKRINGGCVQCHAALPEHHPPKLECIKCHRMAPPS